MWSNNIFRVVYYVLSVGSNSSPKMVFNKIITYYVRSLIKLIIIIRYMEN